MVTIIIIPHREMLFLVGLSSLLPFYFWLYPRLSQEGLGTKYTSNDNETVNKVLFKDI